MRHALTLALIVLATPLTAQSAREAVFNMMAEELVSQGIPRPVADRIVPCFMDRLTDAEVDRLNSTNDPDERQVVITGMSDLDGAAQCAQAAFNQ